MATLAWPAGVRPLRVAWQHLPKSAAQSSPFTHAVQAQGLAPALWSVTMTFDRLRRSEIAALEGLIGALDGQGGRVAVPAFGRETPLGVATGTPRVRNRENRLLRSQEFDHAAWTKGPGSTVTANAATAPDGTLTAERVTPDGVGLSYVLQSIALTGGTSYATSVYAKADVSDDLIIAAGAGIWTPSTVAAFNLTAGTVSGTANDKIEDAGDGWWRCTSVREAVGTGTNGRPIYADVFGVGAAGASVLVWGAQMEARATPGPYIATTDTALTNQPSTGSTLYTDGWTPGVAGILQPGDRLSLNNQLHRIVGVDAIDSDAWGNATLPIRAPLRTSPVDATALTLASPTVDMRLVSDAQGAIEQLMTHNSVTLQLAEAYP